MSHPLASRAFAFTKTSNAVSVPSRCMRLARRRSRAFEGGDLLPETPGCAPAFEPRVGVALLMQSRNQPRKLSRSTFATNATGSKFRCFETLATPLPARDPYSRHHGRLR